MTATDWKEEKERRETDTDRKGELELDKLREREERQTQISRERERKRERRERQRSQERETRGVLTLGLVLSDALGHPHRCPFAPVVRQDVVTVDKWCFPPLGNPISQNSPLDGLCKRVCLIHTVYLYTCTYMYQYCHAIRYRPIIQHFEAFALGHVSTVHMQQCTAYFYI